jgi:Family of unknown function (DUF6159)
MNKIKRSGRLLKASFAVLFREKKLLLFPLIATGMAAIVALFFIAPIILQPTGFSYTSGEHWETLLQTLPVKQMKFANLKVGTTTSTTTHYWIAALFALSYFTSMFLATFCNVAFYHEIMQALGGNAVSIRRGFRFAAARWRAVLLWSLFAGLVGYIINAIEQRVSFLGRIIAGFIGFAWSIACVFIIPTLVREKETENPLKLLRASAGTLKRTWGELVIGFAGMELAFGFATLLLIIVAMLTGGAATFFICGYFHWSEWWILPVVLCEWFSLAMLLGVIGSVVNPVYRCALYIYATEGVVPGSFDKELLDSAWKVK